MSVCAEAYRDYKRYVRSQCDFCSTSYVHQLLQTPCSFAIASAVFQMEINCYKPDVRSWCDFCSISHVNHWLQTLSSFPMRFLLYFVCKSVVTNPMFVPSPISAKFHIYIYINRWLQTLCSFSMRFLQYFAFWKLRCNLGDRARILSTQVRFRGQELSCEHLDVVSLTGVAFWALA